MGTMAVALGTLGFVVTKGATQGGGSSTRLSQVITEGTWSECPCGPASNTRSLTCKIQSMLKVPS